MRYRPLGSRTNCQVSEIGFGTWSYDGYDGAADQQAREAHQLGVDLGCTLFDTAPVYGAGRAEQMLGDLVRSNAVSHLVTATKITPLNGRFPSRRGDRLEDAFPPEHISACARRSLDNLGVRKIGLLQFHGWEDAWAHDGSWQRAVMTLKDQGLIDAIGISVNRWEPWNVIRTLQTEYIDAVQVIYNIFDQAPEDELFPACRELGVGVIARVPLDEGSLGGMLSTTSSWPDDDFRSKYFGGASLIESVERVERLMPLVPDGGTLAELSLRFILANPDVSTVIPGMRRLEHVRANVAVSNLPALEPGLVAALREHRWERTYEPDWY
jgi:aryl-alcohol dehydrogenase-like predicted oxidoreductase